MRVSHPKVALAGDQVVLSCDVAFDGEERSWWISAPKDLIRFMVPSLDPFLPLATLLASYLGQDLQLDQAISEQQAKGLTAASTMFTQWWGWSVPQIEISRTSAESDSGLRPSDLVQLSRSEPDSELRSSSKISGDQAGLLFTRGVDSTASLVAARNGSAARVTHLIGIDGLEPNHSPQVAAEVWADTQAVADLVGLPLIRLRTNLREQADMLLPWGSTHGAVLVGTGLSLSQMLGTLCISQTVTDSDDLPHGSSPNLDPMWSTDLTQVVAVHSGLNRVEKAAVVSTEPKLAAAIKVCWETDTRGNCGRCYKCLHTLTCFELVGASQLVEQAFDRPFSSSAIFQLAGPSSGVALQQVMEAIDEDHAELKEAWEDFLSRIQNGQRRGLAGLSPAARFAASGLELGTDDLVGWGANSVPIPVSLHECHSLSLSSANFERPIDWCVVDRNDSASVELAAELTDHWPEGAVLLVDADISGAPPSAVSRLLVASKVRCWLSAAPF
ncbi:MAG: hypothetical protein WD029_05865, partial [Microthrixaceae bacterium]